MELVEVISRAHFENPQTGAVSRKQRLRIGVELAKYLKSLDLIDYANPTVTVAKTTAKTEVENLGGGAPSMLLPQAPVLPEQIAPTLPRGRRGRAQKY
jgi:hypothetical protein